MMKFIEVAPFIKRSIPCIAIFVASVGCRTIQENKDVVDYAILPQMQKTYKTHSFISILSPEEQEKAIGIMQVVIRELYADKLSHSEIRELSSFYSDQRIVKLHKLYLSGSEPSLKIVEDAVDAFDEYPVASKVCSSEFSSELNQRIEAALKDEFK